MHNKLSTAAVKCVIRLFIETAREKKSPELLPPKYRRHILAKGSRKFCFSSISLSRLLIQLEFGRNS